MAVNVKRSGLQSLPLEGHELKEQEETSVSGRRLLDPGRFQLTFTRGSWELPSGHTTAGRQVLSIPSISAIRLLLTGARVCRALPGWEKHI